ERVTANSIGQVGEGKASADQRAGSFLMHTKKHKGGQDFMAEKTVATTTSGKQMAPDKERTRAEERYIQPAVDIYEKPDGLVLLADLPGVSPNDLDVRLEDNILTIKARAKHAVEADPIY